MILNNGVTDEPISVFDLDTVSVDPKRFVYKCRKELWDDVLYEAVGLALSSKTVPDIYTDVYEEIVSETKLYIGFHIQKKYVILYADLIVTTVTGETLKKQLPIDATKAEISEILDYVISNGCPGIQSAYAAYFSANYLNWKNTKK